MFFLILPCSTQAFVLGLKSTDNTVQNIVDIEKTYQLYLPIVAFIYDPWEKQDVVAELEKMKAELGDQRIYHISVSPNQFSAEEVANGAFDEQYKLFFQTIKRLKLKVVFRTMHEMNGGRYPRGSNPEMFKKSVDSCLGTFSLAGIRSAGYSVWFFGESLGYADPMKAFSAGETHSM